MSFALKQSLRRSIAASPIRQIVVAQRHRALDPRDVMIASYPKSGNTWLRMLLSSLVAGRIDSLDDLPKYVPELEALGRMENAYRLSSGGRMVKTHEQWTERYCRGVYVVRDCRDVAVSYYWHQLGTGQFDGEFDDFFKKFVRGGVDGYGRWDQHISSWLNAAEGSRDQFLVIHYEDMLRDAERILEKVARFIGLDVTSGDVTSAVVENSPERMRLKEKAAKSIPRSRKIEVPFVRFSKEGGWQSIMSTDQAKTLRREMGEVAVRLGYEW